MPYDERLVTMDDVVHGGVSASLIDTADMAAGWATDAVPESLSGSTVTLDVDYVAAARGKDLCATATVVKRGRSLCFSEVTEPDGRLVARGSVVQQLG